MAAALATAVKGQDVIANAQDLKTIAAEQLDIDRWAFEPVVSLLSELDFVRNVRRSGQSTQSFYESVPEDFERLYETLGEEWESRNPSELEKALIHSVDILSKGPKPTSSLDVDPSALQDVLALGDAAQAIRTTRVGESPVAYSPFFAYERPEAVGTALSDLDLDEVRSAFEGVRAYQGLPVSLNSTMPVLTGLIGAGLMAGPFLETPDGEIESFAVAPYGLPPQLRTLRRPVLDKALAIVASVRMGEHFGGITSLRSPLALLRKLQDPSAVTARHTSSKRQYAVLRRLGVVRFVEIEGRHGIQLIDTADNIEALELAMNLVAHGEATTAKEPSAGAQQALLQAGSYGYPIQNVSRARKSGHHLPDSLVERIFESAMGRLPIE